MKTTFVGAETLVANALIILSDENKNKLTYEKLVKYANAIQRQLLNKYDVIPLINGKCINALREFHSDFFIVEGDAPYSVITLQKGVSVERLKEYFFYSIGNITISDAFISEESKKVLFE